MRALAFAAVVVSCASAAAVGLNACSSETTGTTDTTCSTEAPTLEIVSPAEGACVPVSDGPDAFVPVVVRAKHFKLVPPGGCNGCVNCGHLALFVNGTQNNTGVSSIIDVLFQGKIPDRFADLELEVKLVDDDGNPWQPPVDAGADSGTTVEGSVLAAAVRITTASSCDGSSSSSSSSGGGMGGGSTSSSSGSGGGMGGGSTSSSSGSGGSSTGGSSAGGSGTGGGG